MTDSFPGIPAIATYATADNIRVYYQSFGIGSEAIVFVHGFPCDGTFWREQVAYLQDKIRVLILDLPGFGLSDKPERQYTIDLFADAIAAVLQNAGVEKAVLVGHSMGVIVVRHFYRKHPERVKSLILVDGPLKPLLNIEDAPQALAPFYDSRYLDAAIAFTGSFFTASSPPYLANEVKAALMRIPQQVAIDILEATFDAAYHTPDPIAVPVLAVYSDSLNWAADQEQLLKSFANKVDYHIWQGVGHLLMLERSQEFNELVAEFLA